MEDKDACCQAHVHIGNNVYVPRRTALPSCRAGFKRRADAEAERAECAGAEGMTRALRLATSAGQPNLSFGNSDANMHPPVPKKPRGRPPKRQTQQPDVLQSAQRCFDSTLQWQREAQEALTTAEQRLRLAEADAKQLLEQYNELCQKEEHLALKQWNFVNAKSQEQGPHSLVELLQFVRGAKSLHPHVMIHNYRYGVSLPEADLLTPSAA
ncbi:hypothetical protein WJX72_008846 [[Myrmecia] bisecta]|uniref:Uncharacterized protein n=1 Tax=[Myrmecia] bisecta TaxID=41462 RepID=A0AAW1P9B7_9CHLO